MRMLRAWASISRQAGSFRECQEFTNGNISSTLGFFVGQNPGKENETL
jgi:hypothetical protein